MFNPAHVERLRNTGSCEKCDLSAFNFPQGASLSGANLSVANLSKADLRSANLISTNLSGTIGLKRF